MTDCISLSNCFSPSVSFPVTRYSTDTPRAWAILKAETTSGNRSLEIHDCNVKNGTSIISASPCCVILFDFIRGFTLFQNIFAVIFSISALKNREKKGKCHKKLLTLSEKVLNIIKERGQKPL